MVKMSILTFLVTAIQGGLSHCLILIWAPGAEAWITSVLGNTGTYFSINMWAPHFCCWWGRWQELQAMSPAERGWNIDWVIGSPLRFVCQFPENWDLLYLHQIICFPISFIFYHYLYIYLYIFFFCTKLFIYKYYLFPKTVKRKKRKMTGKL